MLPKGLILRGYLVGDLGTRVHGCPHPTGIEISAGDTRATVTMPAPLELEELASNLGFPGLRRFSEWRRLLPSQLLQMATLPYI